MFAKIINEKTKEVQIVVGEKMISLTGATEMEVEQAYNGAWYVKGYSPQESDEEKKAKKRAQYIAKLSDIDEKSVRPLRAQIAGTATQEDLDKIAEYEAQAGYYRNKIRELGE